jgi:SPP1 family predicted phage head-tail adaptor
MENITSPLKIGMLDEEIQIQRKVSTYDQTGGEIKTWQTLYTVLARTEYPNTGSTENFEAGMETTLRRVVFTIRFEDDIEETDRIVHDGDTYDMLAIQPVGRRMYMKLLTTMRKP